MFVLEVEFVVSLSYLLQVSLLAIAESKADTETREADVMWRTSEKERNNRAYERHSSEHNRCTCQQEIMTNEEVWCTCLLRKKNSIFVTNYLPQ